MVYQENSGLKITTELVGGVKTGEEQTTGAILLLLRKVTMEMLIQQENGVGAMEDMGTLNVVKVRRQ